MAVLKTGGKRILAALFGIFLVGFLLAGAVPGEAITFTTVRPVLSTIPIVNNTTTVPTTTTTIKTLATIPVLSTIKATTTSIPPTTTTSIKVLATINPLLSTIASTIPTTTTSIKVLSTINPALSTILPLVNNTTATTTAGPSLPGGLALTNASAIPVELAPGVLETLSKKSLAFIAAGSGVAVVDRGTHTQIANLSLNFTPLDVALHPSDKILYVLGSKTVGSAHLGQLYRINTTTLKPISFYTFSTSFRARSLYVDPVGRVYAAGEHNPSNKAFVHVFAPGAPAPTHYISFLGAPYAFPIADIVFSPDGNRAFIGAMSIPGFVYEVNWLTHTLYGHQLGIYTGPKVLSLAQHYGKVYAVKQPSDRVMYLKYPAIDKQSWQTGMSLVDIEATSTGVASLYGVGTRVEMGTPKQKLYRAYGLKTTNSSAVDFSLSKGYLISAEASAPLPIPGGRIAQSVSISWDSSELYILDASGTSYPVGSGRTLYVYDAATLGPEWSVNITPYVLPFTKVALTKNKIDWNHSPPAPEFHFILPELSLPKNIFEFPSANDSASNGSSTPSSNFSFELGSLIEPELVFPFFEIPDNSTYPDNSSTEETPEEPVPEESIPDPVVETPSSSGGSGGSSGGSGGFSGGAPPEISSATGNETISTQIEETVFGGEVEYFDPETGAPIGSEPPAPPADNKLNPQPEPPAPAFSIPIISPLLEAIGNFFKMLFGGGK